MFKKYLPGISGILVPLLLAYIFMNFFDIPFMSGVYEVDKITLTFSKQKESSGSSARYKIEGEKYNYMKKKEIASGDKKYWYYDAGPVSVNVLIKNPAFQLISFPIDSLKYEFCIEKISTIIEGLAQNKPDNLTIVVQNEDETNTSEVSTRKSLCTPLDDPSNFVIESIFYDPFYDLFSVEDYPELETGKKYEGKTIAVLSIKPVYKKLLFLLWFSAYIVTGGFLLLVLGLWKAFSCTNCQEGGDKIKKYRRKRVKSARSKRRITKKKK